jgi:hypothetical protein
MPFIDANPDTSRVPNGVAPDVPQAGTALETLGAAFRQDNEVVSLARRMWDGAFPPVPDYNPLPDIKGTPYFDQHADAFAGSRSPTETEHIKRRIDEEEADRKVLDAAGLGGMAAQLLAGIANPSTWLVPVGGEMAVAARGARLAQAGRMAAGFGAGAAVSEGILQQTQETRTAGESLTNIATATLLGALLGPLTVARMSPVERVAAENALHADRLAMARHAGNKEAEDVLNAANTRPAGESGIVPGGEAPLAPEGGLAGDTLGASVGAAATDTRTAAPVRTILGGLLDRFDPMSRLMGSRSEAARRAAVDLAETPLLTEQNLRGIPTTAGPALDRSAKLLREQANIAAHDEVQRLFSEYRFGDPETTFPRLRAQMESFGGRSSGYMTFEQFDAEIAKAMRRNDQHDIPQVQQAAQFLRKHYDEWKERAINAGFFPEDVKPVGADSYLNRIYNREAIGARRGEFVDKVTEYFKRDQDEKRIAQDRLSGLNDQLKTWSDKAARWQGKLERLASAQERIAARLNERSMEVRRTGKRVGALKERETDIADELTEVESFIRDARADLKDPALQARVDQLEQEVSDLRRLDRRVTEADLRRIEDEEIRGILSGPMRTAAEIVAGRRNPPKAPSFINYIVANGGVSDRDVAHVIGGAKARPGLVNKQGRSLDEWGEKLANEYSGFFPNGRPTPDQVLTFIDDAMRGQPPGWWVESMSKADRELIDAGKLASALDELFNRAGVDVKNVRDVGKLLRDGRMGDVTLQDLDKIAADMEAAGQIIPASMRRADVEEQLGAGRAEIQKIRSALSDAITARAAAERRYGKATAVTDEAARGERANRGRLGVLQDRLDRAELRQELIVDAIDLAKRQRDAVRAEIEQVIGAWEGRSASDAKNALKAREKYAAESGRDAASPRLESADAAVDRVVRRILGSDRNISDIELRARAEETTDRILGSPDGRLAYDEYRGGPQTPGRTGEPAARGPLAARRFAIPDAEIEDFLEPSALKSHRDYLRTIVPDVLLTERFGDTGMTEAFRKINEDYARLSAEAKTEKARTSIENERRKAIDDLSAVRDRIRGVYGFSPDLPVRNAARVANAVKSYNVISLMGMSAVSSLPDMAGQVFRHGLSASFNDAWSPFVSYLMGGSDAWKQAAKQYRAMGIATEMFSSTRLHAMSDITELYRPGSRVERALSWGADKFQMVNMLAPWTDWAKTNASLVAGAEILRATKAVAEGKVTPRQMRQLAESNIDAATATRIWEQFQRGGEVRDGVHLPNTADWTDKSARMAFEGAVAREADISVVTPGQEKPLWLSTPVISLFGQFKSFTAAATQRVLLANLQRADAQALQGLIFSMGLGMIAYRLNNLAAGKPVSDKPQDWIKEAIDRGGITGWIGEGNNLASKMTRGGVDMYRLIGADKPLSRMASRSILDQLVGPTAGKIEAITRTAGAAASGDWNAGDTAAIRRLTAMQNVFYLRRLFDEMEGGANRRLGLEGR